MIWAKNSTFCLFKTEFKAKKLFATYPQWIRMGILIWFMKGVKYYSHIWFLHTTGLLRYHWPQENWKRPRKLKKDTLLRNDHSRTKKGSRRSKNFIWQKITKSQKNSLVNYLLLWFLVIFRQTKFFDLRDPFLVLELSFLKRVSRLAFKALYMTS